MDIFTTYPIHHSSKDKFFSTEQLSLKNLANFITVFPFNKLIFNCFTEINYFIISQTNFHYYHFLTKLRQKSFKEFIAWLKQYNVNFNLYSVFNKGPIKKLEIKDCKVSSRTNSNLLLKIYLPYRKISYSLQSKDDISILPLEENIEIICSDNKTLRANVELLKCRGGDYFSSKIHFNGDIKTLNMSDYEIEVIQEFILFLKLGVQEYLKHCNDSTIENFIYYYTLADYLTHEEYKKTLLFFLQDFLLTYAVNDLMDSLESINCQLLKDLLSHVKYEKSQFYEQVYAQVLKTHSNIYYKDYEFNEERLVTLYENKQMPQKLLNLGFKKFEYEQLSNSESDTEEFNLDVDIEGPITNEPIVHNEPITNDNNIDPLLDEPSVDITVRPIPFHKRYYILEYDNVKNICIYVPSNDVNKDCYYCGIYDEDIKDIISLNAGIKAFMETQGILHLSFNKELEVDQNVFRKHFGLEDILDFTPISEDKKYYVILRYFILIYCPYGNLDEAFYYGKINGNIIVNLNTEEKMKLGGIKIFDLDISIYKNDYDSSVFENYVSMNKGK